MISQKRGNGKLMRTVRIKLIIRGFKALKQMTKMNYLYLQKPEDALTTYRELLGYTKVSFPSFGPSHKLIE
jgi:hypothetical protein